MDKRRTFALIFSSAACAFVLSHPAMTPRAGTPMPVLAESGALFTASDGDEPMMTALRLQASDALARLRAIEQPR